MRSNDTKLIYEKNEDLNINFMSVHKSKGLEEDNVILINLENSIVGFPNQMIDNPLLNFVINDSDQFPNGEERRLFYVALTRTKNNVYLLVPEIDKSEFVVELENHIEDLEIISRNKNQEESYDDIDEFMGNKDFYFIKTKIKCPICKTGDVILKIVKTKSGKDIFYFLECSHRRCKWEGGPYFSKLELLDEMDICPKCGNVRYVADGKYGLYLKCLNGCKQPKLKSKMLKKAKIKSKNTESVSPKKSEISNFEEIKIDLKCPECNSGNIIIKKNKKTNQGKFTCSNCKWDGGIFDKTGQIDTIDYCANPECNGVTYMRNGRYGEFRSCSHYFKTKCDGGKRFKKSSNSKKTSKRQANKKTSRKETSKSMVKEIKVDMVCPSCKEGHVILLKNMETGKGLFQCSNISCNWNGGPFNKSEELLDTLAPCPEPNCDGLTYVLEGKYGPFRVCTYYAKTKCNAGKK